MGFLEIKNNMGIPFPSQKVEVFGQSLSPQKQTLTTNTIAPFGVVKIPIYFDRLPILTNTSATVTIQIDQHIISQTFITKPLFFSRTAVIGGVFIAVCILIISIIAARSRRLPFFR